MNTDHGEALLLIARHFTGETADEAAMTAVDRLGFHLRLKVWRKNSRPESGFLARSKK